MFEGDYSRTDKAFDVWRDVLLNGRDHPGQFRTFWFFFDYVGKGHALGKGVNRYIFHAADYDVVANSTRSYAYAHLPGLFLIGALEGVSRSEFRGFDISYKGGQYIALEDKRAPQLLFELIKEKNALKREAGASMSRQQQDRIKAEILKDPEKAIYSPLFRTYLHDI